MKRIDEMVERSGSVTTRIRSFGVFGFVLLAGSLIGCGCAWRPGEWPTSVRLEGGKAPVFVLSGGGSVAIFTVFGPDFMTKAEKPLDENFALWKIKPSGGYLYGTRISDLGSITYGVIPFGYKQIKPSDGAAPPPLVEGQKCFYVVETTNAAGASGYFEIKNSHAVPTSGSGPCFLDDHGKTIRVPCPKALEP